MSSFTARYFIVGGGLAAGSCVQHLREEDSEGGIVLATSEPVRPYHRPPLSKGYLRGEEGLSDVMYESSSWWEDNNVTLLTDNAVTELDPGAHKATLQDGSSVEFEKALLATGSSVRRMDVPGADLEGVHYLRTLADCEAIKQEAASAQRVVLIGGSFIATELAASLTAMGLEVELVMLEQQPLERFFGGEVGKHFGDVLKDHGVVLNESQHLARFEGTGRRVNKVVTEEGLSLDCDFVVIGAGVIPNLDLAKRAGLKTDKGVLTDKFLEASSPDIFVAGDIAEYDSVVHQRKMRVEHWDVAFNQGRIAARNMMGKGEVYDVVPYFWSDLADWSSMETVGPAMDWDDIWWNGRPGDNKFTAWYIADGLLVGALSVGRSQDIELARELMTQRKNVRNRREELEDTSR